jgi:VWFA-related protein
VKRVAWMAVVALTSTLALAQQGYFETFEVRLHDLEVVVTDAKGAPVHGLTKEDFLVLENGVPQAVTNFSVYDSGTGTASSMPAGQPGQKPVQTNAQAGDDKPPARRFVFFVDDMAVRKPARGRLIRAALRLVDQLQEGDLATVIRPTGAKRIALPYTTDTAAVRTALSAAIASCGLHLTTPGQYEIEALVNGLENARTDSERKAARGEYGQRATERVQQRLAQLRALIGSMAGIEGRKVLVLITSGLPSNPGRDAVDLDDQIRMGTDRAVTEWGPSGDFNPLIDELARTAAANGVTIYGLQPELSLDLAVRRITAGSATIGSTYEGAGHAGGQSIVGPAMFDELEYYRERTLRSLSEKTGGRYFRGFSVIDDVFRQVASDLSVYYSLAYRATGEHDKPRSVVVQVRNRPDLKVRTRTEVVDRSPEREMGDLVASTLLFPRDVNELHLTVTTGPLKRAGKAVTVPFDIVIPLESLTFLESADGRYVATIDVHFSTASTQNDYTTTGHREQNIEITAAQYDARAGTTYRYKTGIEIPAGPVRIALGVLDRASHLTGFRTVDVDAR